MAEHLLFRANACPQCRKPYTGGQVLLGWRPCDCEGAPNGGHISAYCRSDTGGCGHTYLQGHVGPDAAPDQMPNFGQH